MKLTEIQQIVTMNSTIINSLASLATTSISLLTIIVTYQIARKQRKDAEVARKQQQEQFEKKFENQRQRYMAEKAHNELVDRLHEQPYLVFRRIEKFHKESSGAYYVALVFINKGRGSAYDIVPGIECKAEGFNCTVTMRRCEPIQGPITFVNEEIVTYWEIKSETDKFDFMVYIPIKYKDASERKYIQNYRLAIDSSGKAMAFNYANPELIED